MPLRFKIQKRRLLYWWHLLHVNKSEIIFRYYNAQNLTLSATENSYDWTHQINNDKKELNIDLDDQEVRKLSKNKFKSYLDHKIFVAVRNWLEKMRLSHSKCKYLPQFSGKPDNYILSKYLSQDEICKFLKLKTRMIKISDNYCNGNPNILCKMCSLFPETQSHLMTCEKIRKQLEGVIDFSTVDYKFLTGTNSQQETLAKIYTVILKTREDILQDS